MEWVNYVYIIFFPFHNESQVEKMKKKIPFNQSLSYIYDSLILWWSYSEVTAANHDIAGRFIYCPLFKVLLFVIFKFKFNLLLAEAIHCPLATDLDRWLIHPHLSTILFCTL